MLARYLLFLIGTFMLTGCVKYYDSSGQVASRSVEFDCNQKCGYYDTRMNAFGTAFCIEDCMQSKGYSQNNKK